MSVYLSGGDLATYGVPTATAAQILQASNLVDSYLERPEGIVWSPDYAGRPCFMAGLSPQLSLALPAAVSPGSGVQITLPIGPFTDDIIGEVFIVDRATPANTEAVVVTAVNGSTLTFQSFALSHAQGVTIETGLVLLEERPMPSKRTVTRVSKFPLVRLLGGSGRYAYGRRSDQVAGLYNDTNLLAALQTFGGPPAWVPFDVAAASISTATGEVWVPAGILLAYYSDVRLRYVAGFSSTNIPSPIKQATAMLVMGLQSYGSDLVGNVKKIMAGGTSIERWGQSLVDDDVKALIDQYRAKLLF